MKKALLVLAALAASSSALAGVSILGRFDYDNQQNYKVFSTQNNADGMSRFLSSGLVMDVNGKVGDDITFTGRLDLLGQALGNNQTFAYNAYTFVDRMYLTKGFGSNFSMSFGRLYNEDGGFEKEQMDHFTDYGTTLANGGTLTDAAIVGGLVRPQVINPVNLNGISADYKMDSHHLQVAVNDASNAGVVATAAHKRNDMSINYIGDFMDHNLMVRVGYLDGAFDTITAPAGTTLATVQSVNQTDVHAGIKYLVAGLDLTAEYFMNQAKSNDNAVLVNPFNKTYSLNSLYVQAGYKVDGGWRPFVKYEMSSYKAANNDNNAGAAGDISFKRNAYTVGVEYQPKATDMFAYHLTYTGVDDKAGLGAIPKADSAILMAGITVTADVLK